MAIAYKDKIIDARTDRILLPETVASQVKMDENNEENLLDIITKLREENDQLNKDLSKSIENLRTYVEENTVKFLDYGKGQTYTSQFTCPSQGKIFIYPTNIGNCPVFRGSSGSVVNNTVSINSVKVYNGVTSHNSGNAVWSSSDINTFAGASASAKADGASSCAEFLVDTGDVISMSYASVVFVPFK